MRSSPWSSDSRLGAYTGWRRGGPIDLVGKGLSLILYSMPYFVIGMLLLVVFATGLGWFPTSGMLTLGRGYASADRPARWTSPRHFTLPVTTVALGLVGGSTRSSCARRSSRRSARIT